MIKVLLRDSLIYGLATVLSRGLAILTVPFYTRLLSAPDFGVLDLLLTLGVLVNLIVPLEVGQGLARFWSEAAPGQGRERLASTTFCFSALMYGLFIVIALIAAPQLNAWLGFADRHLPALQVGIVLVACNGLFFSLQNQFRWELRSMEYAWTSLVYAILLLVLGIGLAGPLGMGLLGVLIGQLLAAAAAGVLAWWRLRGTLAFVVDLGQLRALLAFSWPLVFSGVATYLSLYANRLILNSLTSLETVGLYAVGARVAGLAALIIVGIQGALTPLIYAHHQEPETPGRLATIFSGFVALALLTCLGAGLFAPELVRLFAPEEYAPASRLVAILAPAVLLSQMYIFAPGIPLAKKTYWQLAVFTASAAVCVGLSLLMIPPFGAVGAAWSALASSLVFFALWAFLSQRWYPVPFEWGRISIASAGFLACLLADYRLHELALPPLWSFMLRVLLLVFLALIVVGAGLLEIRQAMEWIRRRAKA